VPGTRAGPAGDGLPAGRGTVMRYELFVGLRYLRAKRREGFISLITLISTLGLIIGVMTLNIVLAVFTGFEEDLRDRIVGFNPEIVIFSFVGNIHDYPDVVERVEQVPGVQAAAPFVYGQVMLSAGERVVGVAVRAVGADSERVVSLRRLLRVGTIEALAQGGEVKGGHLPALILGKDAAEKLHVGVGDAVNVMSTVATPSGSGLTPRVRRFVVVGLFDSGMAEYDSSLAYMDLAVAQQFFGMEGAVSGIEARTGVPSDAKATAVRVREALGVPYRVRDWMDINYNLFATLRVGKMVYFIVLLLIVLVAAFNIVSMLIMVVMEKRKDIAVLKSMGATRGGVGRIFVFKGLIIAGLGIAVGNAGAYLACLLLQRYRFVELPRDVYSIDTLQVRIYPEYFFAVSAAALLLCLLASLYPARQAARLTPVDVIRYE
jgi:lipoprotein-releasing system permease protein